MCGIESQSWRGLGLDGLRVSGFGSMVVGVCVFPVVLLSLTYQPQWFDRFKTYLVEGYGLFVQLPRDGPYLNGHTLPLAWGTYLTRLHNRYYTKNEALP